jgi:hypothetical protein
MRMLLVLPCLIAATWLPVLAQDAPDAPDPSDDADDKPLPASAPVASRPAGEHLTRGAAWQYRSVVGQRPGQWHDNLQAAAAELKLSRLAMNDWPVQWSLFGPMPAGAWLPEPALKTITGTVTRAGAVYTAQQVRSPDGRFDFSSLGASSDQRRVVCLVAAITTDQERTLTAHVASGCDMRWWLDAKAVFYTDPQASTRDEPKSFRLVIPKGKHIIAVRLSALTDAGWSLTTDATTLVSGAAEKDQEFAIEARKAFVVGDGAAIRSLTVDGIDRFLPLVNAHQVAPPLPGLVYRRIAGVPGSVLRPGPNELTYRWSVEQMQTGLAATGLRNFGAIPPPTPLTPTAELYGLSDSDAQIDLGPILGACGDDYFTVTCRTNMLAEVSLEIRTPAGRTLTTPAGAAGLYHRIRVDRPLRDVSSYRLVLRTSPHSTVVTADWRLPQRQPGPLRMAFVGDPQSGQRWGSVAGAIERQRPDMLVILGDLVGSGQVEEVWREKFWLPAKSLLATVPTYAILGNHDHAAAIFGQIMFHPGDQTRWPNWSQQIGDVLLVGIDGERNFRSGSADHAWLSGLLRQAPARYVFLCSHYPPWASSWHGDVGADGKPREWQMRQSQDAILPMLIEHGATALLTGHEHCYERNEPPGGVPHITTGGGGGAIRGRHKDAAVNNPHSKVFANAYNYVLIEVSGDEATLTAKSLDGKTLDTLKFAPRKPGAATRPASAPAAGASQGEPDAARAELTTAG